MRNQLVRCPKCDKQSRVAKIWHCPHCDYLKLNQWGHKVTKLREEPWPEPKPKPLTPKAIRKAEREQLAVDIADLKRPDISKLRLKAGLRVLPK